jgi:hypothetical protein
MRLVLEINEDSGHCKGLQPFFIKVAAKLREEHYKKSAPEPRDAEIIEKVYEVGKRDRKNPLPSVGRNVLFHYMENFVFMKKLRFYEKTSFL